MGIYGRLSRGTSGLGGVGPAPGLCAGVHWDESEAARAGAGCRAGLGWLVLLLDGTLGIAADRGPGPGTVVTAQPRAGPGSRPDFSYNLVPGSGPR